MAQIKTFPADCTTECPHYKTWDMSVDDWTSYCDILKEQVDDCDGDYIRFRCPLEKEFVKEEKNEMSEELLCKNTNLQMTENG